MNSSIQFLKGVRSRPRKIALFLAFACLGVGQTLAADPGSPGEFLKRHPAGSIQSGEAADRALAEAAQERAKVEANFTKEESGCYSKFFVTSCTDSAKERRRIELNRIRPVELEARSFKRHARAAERDQALNERHANEEAEAQQRAADQGERSVLREEKASNDNAQRQARAVDAQHNEALAKQRNREHAAKQARIKAEQASEAKKRAENVAEYEKKMKAAQQHQREVAAKKLAKEAAKSASASASASCCATP